MVFLLKSEYEELSRVLQDFSQYKAVVGMVLIRPSISNSSTNFLREPITTGSTIAFRLHNFLCSRAGFEYLSLFYVL